MSRRNKGNKRNQQRRKSFRNDRQAKVYNESNQIKISNKIKTIKAFSPQKIDIDSLNIEGISSINPFWNASDEN
jgi:hypothetical protein